jgi:hypothetical protein
LVDSGIGYDDMVFQIVVNKCKYITLYLVVLDGITYTLLYFYQQNGMDSNEYNINSSCYGTQLSSTKR